MSDIVLHPTSVGCVTCVSNAFIDNYMVEADGEYVKIYLYLLRAVGSGEIGLSVSQMADALDHTQKDIKKALCYWEKQGLLLLEFDSANDICGIYLQEPNTLLSNDNTSHLYSDEVYSEPLSLVELPDNITAMPIQDLQALPDTSGESEQLSQILYFMEKLLAHPLSPEMSNTVCYWHDGLNISWDAVELLIETCAEKGKTHINYINAIALDMASAGVVTIDDAKKFFALSDPLAVSIKKAFGITHRELVDIELKMIKKWSSTYGFNNEIILEACNRSIMETQRGNFKYADTILTKWHQADVKSLSDVAVLDDLHAKNQLKSNITPVKSTNFVDKRLHNFPERDTNYSELQKKLLNNQ